MNQESNESPAPGDRLRKLLLRILTTLLVLLLLLCLGLRLRYGGGDYYPDLSARPLLDGIDLEIVQTFSEPIGNVAVSKTGRIFFTVHPESRPTGAKLLESIEGKARPFPDEASQKLFDAVLGVVVDRQERLWTIDHGQHASAKVRLLCFDLASGKLVLDYIFSSEVAPLGSFLQDLQVDAAGQTVYIADASFARRQPAIVVFDVATMSARRLLESHESLFPQDWIIQCYAGDMTFFGGVAALKLGIDGIALSRDDAYLCYGAVNHDGLFRIATADLKNDALSAAELAKRVERIGKKPLSDGLSTDIEGNVLITDVEHNAVLRMSPDGKLETLIKTPKIRWADALSYGPDDWLYLADSAIPDLVLRSKSHMESQAPYFIYRFKPGIPGIPGQ